MTRGITAAITIAIIAILMLVTIVVAHTPSASLTCEGGLSVDLQKYSYDAQKQGHINHVTVTLDGDVIHEGPFGNDFQLVKDPLDQFTGHSAVVEIRAWDDPSGSKGWTKTYRLSLDPCATATPTPTISPTPSPSVPASPRPEPTPTPSRKPADTPRPTLPPTDTD